MTDMLVRLYDLPDLSGCMETVEKLGVQVRRPNVRFIAVMHGDTFEKSRSRVAQGNLTPRPSTDTDVSLSTHPASHVRPDCGFCIALRFLPFLVDQ